MTKIAVLGWGSLIWDPQDLRTERAWRPDGPCLPVEFARKSSRDRVTLVLWNDAPTSRTWWTKSLTGDIDEAAENLRVREGPTRRTWIHLVDARGARDLDGRDVTGPEADIVRQWLKGRNELAGAVWTAIEPDGFAGSNLAGEVVQHLQRLAESGSIDAAREYMRRAPETVMTPVRLAVFQAFGWTIAPLPESELHPGLEPLPCSPNS